jgi:hypothetical protein
LPNRRPGHQEDVADQHLLDVLGLAGRLGQEQQRGRGRRRVDDADERLVRHLLVPHAGQREERRADEGEAERHQVDHRGVVVRIVAEQDGVDRAERRDLGERQVDEDHLAQEDVDAEVAVDADQDQAHRQRRQHPAQLAEVAHGRVTLSRMWSMSLK